MLFFLIKIESIWMNGWVWTKHTGTGYTISNTTLWVLIDKSANSTLPFHLQKLLAGFMFCQTISEVTKQIQVSKFCAKKFGLSLAWRLIDYKMIAAKIEARLLGGLLCLPLQAVNWQSFLQFSFQGGKQLHWLDFPHNCRSLMVLVD